MTSLLVRQTSTATLRRGHRLQQPGGVVFVRQSTPWPMRSALAIITESRMWLRNPSGSTMPGAQLAGVGGEVDLRVELMEEREHLHLLVEVVHRDVAVLGHDRVEADHARIGAGQLVADDHLREELLAAERRDAVRRDSGRSSRSPAARSACRSGDSSRICASASSIDGARGGDDRRHVAALHHRVAHLGRRLAGLHRTSSGRARGRSPERRSSRRSRRFRCQPPHDPRSASPERASSKRR